MTFCGVEDLLCGFCLEKLFKLRLGEFCSGVVEEKIWWRAREAGFIYSVDSWSLDCWSLNGLSSHSEKN